MSDNKIGYSDALQELQQILRELEADDIDIDVLAHKVERAAELIRVCRGRINTAEVRVKEIVAGLDQNQPSKNGDNRS
ncbi:MAG: exodeoxyribonuclease VII small subunit [Acidimicrobiia bacterium]|nr:exodeoxyribonuclease VII small subunit [Acidimicrobiia bacterium]MYC58045.1 exodeoxyribonuclease VII small subunit [Acidimicrobiia bacterium]MYG93784.1 exodeoxyribonuclease VII small subunit [Acidimicrobiia bacterium]MYI30782.1 exodeoxyribonuclease VII small subunit [Acidimicrobiia bacterium]